MTVHKTNPECDKHYAAKSMCVVWTDIVDADEDLIWMQINLAD